MAWDEAFDATIVNRGMLLAVYRCEQGHETKGWAGDLIRRVNLPIELPCHQIIAWGPPLEPCNLRAKLREFAFERDNEE